MSLNTIPVSGVKKKQQVVLYDNDLGNQQLIRVDLIIQEPTNNILTPTPPKYQARFTTGDAKKVGRKELEPRACLCHFTFNNQAVERRVYNPYNPSNGDFIDLIKELEVYQDVECVSYEGENIPKNVEKFVI
jgi:hypothetical protein